LHYFSALFVKRTISKLSSNSWRGTCNFQGGAIFASGADVKIYTSVFESNSAGSVSAANFGFRKFLNFFASILGGETHGTIFNVA
jgi:hypothetical protein